MEGRGWASIVELVSVTVDCCCVWGGCSSACVVRTGMLAAMTNVRHVDFPVVPIAESTSRGMLVQQWLNGSIPFPVPGSSTVLP